MRNPVHPVLILLAALPAASAAAAPAGKPPVMEITRPAGMKTAAGPPEWFTGKVTITGQFQRPAPSRVGGALVRFEPGARTAWHSHPLGQTLIVTEGTGWTQIEGGPILQFSAGDMLWCPPGQKHWHGATPTSAMSHIAIQESRDGSPVTWMEPVGDDQYLAGPGRG
ncbi:MAG TPA: cupin domain-containing protein [Allosphingosinicella sp.]|jgi:quercetin dioxygenase-like cupin family protein